MCSPAAYSKLKQPKDVRGVACASTIWPWLSSGSWWEWTSSAGGLDFLYTGVRFLYLIGDARESVWLSKVELSTWLTPIFNLISAGVLLWASPRVARFAAKFATSEDAASHFR